jgi:type VI secretion system protein VasG
MAEISRVALFGKLNSVAYKAIESATVFCKLRGNPYVELAHWIAQIVQTDNTDIHCIVRHFEIDASRLSADVTAALDKLPRGATAISDLSEHVMDISERAWVYGSLMYGEGAIRTGHLIVGALKTPRLLNVLLGISRQFERIRADTWLMNLLRSWPLLPKRRCPCPAARASLERPVMPWRRPPWASRRR